MGAGMSGNYSNTKGANNNSSAPIKNTSDLQYSQQKNRGIPAESQSSRWCC